MLTIWANQSLRKAGIAKAWRTVICWGAFEVAIRVVYLHVIRKSSPIHTNPSLYLPVPDNVTAWGLVGSESFTFIVALLDPLALGLNVTLTVQLLFPPTLPLQVFVWLKSPGFEPLNVKLDTVIAAVLALVSVTVLVEELPTSMLP
jgi:hypothetical protein